MMKVCHVSLVAFLFSVNINVAFAGGVRGSSGHRKAVSEEEWFDSLQEQGKKGEREGKKEIQMERMFDAKDNQFETEINEAFEMEEQAVFDRKEKKIKRYVADITRREGLGESPGITALEYLGTGYNIIEGNPRGSEISELDPGFRAGVILLEQVQTDLTIDQEYTVPLGTELRYMTSCEYSSTSAEVSTVSEYQKRLKRESRLSVNVGVSGAFKLFSGGADVSYSKSKKFESFQKERSRSQTTSFESSAVCTEFEGRLDSYYDHQLRDPFFWAVMELPVPFNSSVPENVAAYEKFIIEYGTHYVNRVVLGAKQIYSTIMKSEDVLTLREEKVQVEKTLGVKAMFAFNKDDDDSGSSSVTNSGDNNLFNFVKNEGGGSPADAAGETAEKKGSIGINVDVQKSSSKSDFTRQLGEIKQKVSEVIEVNIGGTPPSEAGDWREWAATAKDRPMPIIYDLSPLWDLMESETKIAYRQALQYIYTRGSGDNESETVKRAFNLGVGSPNGRPISTYTVDPLADLRTLTILQQPGNASLDENPFYRYDVLWDGSTQAVSAVFANLIRDNIAPNTKEDENELGFFDNRFTDQFALKNSLNTFGVSKDPGTATIAIFEETDLSSENELNSFTYLTVDNVEDTEELVVGVIHPQGYAVNKVFGKDPGFTVEMENDREFIIKFTRNFTQPPTFIVSPMWFPTSDNRFPLDIGEIQVGLRDCTSSECRVQVGAVQLTGTKTSYINVKSSSYFDDFLNGLNGLIKPIVNIPNVYDAYFELKSFFRPFTGASRSITGVNPLSDLEDIDQFDTDQFLGFSFMAVEPELPSGSLFNSTLGIVHGIVTISIERPYTDVTLIQNDTLNFNYTVLNVSGSGFRATPKFSRSQPFKLNLKEDGGDEINIRVTNQTVGGVRIDFDNAFLGVPTVFASPITGDFEYGRAEVEDIKIIKRKKSLFGGCVLFCKTTTETVTRNAEMVEIPSVLVEHITERSTFIKAGVINTTDLNIVFNGGDTTSIYQPVSFHFVAIGPIKQEPLPF